MKKSQKIRFDCLAGECFATPALAGGAGEERIVMTFEQA